jgi:hypothetical protein
LRCPCARAQLIGYGCCWQLEKYQEQSQLLDPHLESIVKPLAALLRRHALNGAAADIVTVQNVCRLLQTVASVRGYKTVVKFFPNEVCFCAVY